MSTKLRAGVIGCGSISSNHVGGYLNCERYDVVALSDLNESAMHDMDAKFNISTKHYTDARQMLETEKLDVVSICTWHTGHATWTIAWTKAHHTSPEAIANAGGVRWLWPLLLLGGVALLGILTSIGVEN